MAEVASSGSRLASQASSFGRRPTALAFGPSRSSSWHRITLAAASTSSGRYLRPSIGGSIHQPYEVQCRHAKPVVPCGDSFGKLIFAAPTY